MKAIVTFTALTLMVAAATARAGQQIVAGKLTATLAKSGFLGKVALGEHVIVDEQGREGFRGVVLDRFEPSEQASGALDPVLGNAVPSSAFVVKTTADGNRVTCQVAAVAGPVSGDFVISIAPSAKPNALAVTCNAKLKGQGLVASVGLALPIAVGQDEYWRKTTVGGGNPQRRTESWRLDQNHVRRSWPRWRLGGLLVTSPTRYLTWKASRRDTPHLPMDQGNKCPGWLDYSQRQWGLTVFWKDIERDTPAGIWMEADTGVLTLYLHPPSSPPLRLQQQKELSATFELVFHEGPHPATFRPELSRDKYKELLATMAAGSRHTYLRVALGEFNCRDAEDLIDSGVQPSLALATAGRAGWRMRSLCKELGIPFSQARASADAKKYAEELIHRIIEKFGGKTSFRF